MITHISDGFDFLGQNIRKYNGKLLIKPSKNAVKAFLKKVRTIVKENKTATQDLLIRKLNPVIRGWVNYHRYVVSADIFGLVDHRISSAYGSGLAADTNEKVGNGLPTNIGTILITGRGRLQQSLLSAVKISMKNTSSWNTRQILKSSDSRKSPPKPTHSIKNGRDIMRT
ncbi:group II intron maturase-specific domain-containing protein [Faecalibacterium prausnitzii]